MYLVTEPADRYPGDDDRGVSDLSAEHWSISNLGSWEEKKHGGKILLHLLQHNYSPLCWCSVLLVILTGGEICSDALTELVVQLRVHGGGVLGVWPQVPQRVLGDPTRDPLLDGAGALDAQEETVASDDGAGSLPGGRRTVGADVSEMHIGGRVGF